MHHSHLFVLVLIMTASTLALRDKRWLIFPEQDPQRHQFVIGIGIPLEDLEFEALTTGYVLKAEYFLPINESDFRKDPFIIHFMEMNSRKERDLNFPMNRYDLYRSFEMILNQRGLDGRECLLIAICEAGSTPFQEGFNTFGDILHIFLTPSSSEDQMRYGNEEDYLQAEVFGRSYGNCVERYKKCRISLIDVISFVV